MHAVDGVDLDIYPGETLGLVGETGCGKSTLARVAMRLFDTTERHASSFDGRDITRPQGRRTCARFDATCRWCSRTRTRPLTLARPSARSSARRCGCTRRSPKDKIKGDVQELMELVGLNPEHYNRYPHEFSGGQRQRIGVARAIALKPKLIVCDEPVSALDVSIQAQILNLLDRPAVRVQPDLPVHRARPVGRQAHLRPRRRDVSGQDRGAADRRRALHRAEAPVHGRAAVGGADRRPRVWRSRSAASSWKGTFPHRSTRRAGCRFHPRCYNAQERCSTEEPELREMRGNPRRRLPLPPWRPVSSRLSDRPRTREFRS